LLIPCQHDKLSFTQSVGYQKIAILKDILVIRIVRVTKDYCDWLKIKPVFKQKRYPCLLITDKRKNQGKVIIQYWGDLIEYGEAKQEAKLGRTHFASGWKYTTEALWNIVHQWFPTRVPQHPRVLWIIFVGPQATEIYTFLQVSTRVPLNYALNRCTAN
jgi:hypothetical protein